MSMTDPIADMLTRIRNACGSKHRRVDMPVSKMKTEIARILKENNYIQDYSTLETDEGKHSPARASQVRRGRPAGHPRARSASRRPGLRKYVGVAEIPRVRNGLGMAILSTSQGADVRPRGAAGAHRRRAPRPRLVRRADHVTYRQDCRSPIPKGVTVTVDGNIGQGEGPEGRADAHAPRRRSASSKTDSTINVTRPSDESNHKALHGLTRTLIANMVEGVTKGYQKQLEITGVGYKAEVRPYGLQLALGFSHPIEYKAPAGIKLTAPQPTQIVIDGADKEMVGQVAAELRSLRPPEPYKGKGIKYAGEQIRRKAGKAGGK